MEILTKEYITNLKRQNNGELADLAKQYYTNSSYLTYILESLGHLPSSFDYSWILPLLNHPNENVRFWAVKSIGKTSSEANLDLYCSRQHGMTKARQSKERLFLPSAE